MRLIDLDDSAHNHMCFNDEHEIWCIDTNKTVDAVPVIRCKDCKWWNADTCMEWFDTPYVPADGYCFRAERKEK